MKISLKEGLQLAAAWVLCTGAQALFDWAFPAPPGTILGIAPIIGAAAIMGASGIASSMLGKQKFEQQALETPEQQKARMALLNFATSGKLGNLTLGEEQGGLGYGDYGMTGMEEGGLSALQRLLSMGPSGNYDMADSSIKDFLDTSEAGIDRRFQPFSALADRSTAQASAALKRSAGAFGNLYSSRTIQGLGDVAARGNETKLARLAELSDSAEGRKLAATGLALQSAESRQAAQMQQIDASQRYGSLARSLNDQSIKAHDAELMRRRSELYMMPTALASVAGSNSNFGVPSIQTSPYQDLLKMVGQVGGQYFSNQMFLSQFKASQTPGTGYAAPNQGGWGSDSGSAYSATV